jgi:hypothetical protein
MVQVKPSPDRTIPPATSTALINDVTRILTVIGYRPLIAVEPPGTFRTHQVTSVPCATVAVLIDSVAENGGGRMRPKTRRWMVALMALAALVVVGFWAYFGKHDARHHVLGAAIWSTAVLLFLILLILEVAAPDRAANPARNFGFLDPIIGQDGRISTSKTVVFLWTLELAAALTLLAGVVCWGGRGSRPGVDQIFGTGDWDAYFLLLGGPFAAAVIAKGVTTSVSNTDPNAKTATGDASNAAAATAVQAGGTAAAGDLVQNDDGTVSMPDTQYMIFTVVAMAYFLGAFIGNVVTYGKAAATSTTQIGLPAIPPAILGLTSLAALTYVGNKAVANQGLRVSRLSPKTVHANDPVTATLVNLPPTATMNNTFVTATQQGQNPYNRNVTALSLATATAQFDAPSAVGDWQIVVHTDNYSTPAMTLTVT